MLGWWLWRHFADGWSPSPWRAEWDGQLADVGRGGRGGGGEGAGVGGGEGGEVEGGEAGRRILGSQQELSTTRHHHTLDTKRTNDTNNRAFITGSISPMYESFRHLRENIKQKFCIIINLNICRHSFLRILILVILVSLPPRHYETPTLFTLIFEKKLARKRWPQTCLSLWGSCLRDSID